MEMQDIIAKAWHDEEFKSGFWLTPRARWKKAGGDIGSAVQIFIHEQTPTVLHLVLPMKPEVCKKMIEQDCCTSTCEQQKGGLFYVLIRVQAPVAQWTSSSLLAVGCAFESRGGAIFYIAKVVLLSSLSCGGMFWLR